MIPKTEDVKTTPAWKELIKFCADSFPHGELKIKIVNSQPMELLEMKRRIRFDKQATVPKKLTEADE